MQGGGQQSQVRPESSTKGETVEENNHKEEADLQNKLLFLRAAHPDFLDSTFNGTQLKAGSQSSTGAVKAAGGDIAPQTFSKSLT